MESQSEKTINTFKPRPSFGWIWLVVLGLIFAALAIAPATAMGLSSSSTKITLLITIPISLAFLALAVFFPTMRYELDKEVLTLRYGPFLTYQIPLKSIRSIRRRNLSLTIWSAIRFPGIALFKIPYGDAGDVKMCATSALNDILLIETDNGKYGITPADEQEFIALVQSNLKA